MYWSVVGHYTAFASEVLARVPKSLFLGMVGVAMGVIMVLTSIYFYFGKHRWEEIKA